MRHGNRVLSLPLMKGERELLFSITKKDFRIDTFRSGGKGGQNQNSRDTGVRIVHLDSGAVGESRSQRTQGLNKKLAFKHLLANDVFKKWYRIECARRLGQVLETEDNVDSLLNPKHLKVEVKTKDGWKVVG